MMRSRISGDTKEKSYNARDICEHVGILVKQHGRTNVRWNLLNKYLLQSGYTGPSISDGDYINEYDLINALIGTQKGRPFVKELLEDIRNR